VEAVTESAAIPLKGSTRDPERVRSSLSAWLRPRVAAREHVEVSPITLPAASGVANETLLFEARWDGIEQGFVARVASERTLYLDADIRVHAAIYEALADEPGVPVPRVYGYEADPSLLGAPFFVMERIHGDVPGDNPHWRTGGFVVDASPERRRKMWESAVDVLAALHQVDASAFPFLAPAAGASGLADHLDYWRRSLDAATTGEPYETLERGHQWLHAHLPAETPTAFSWGDSRFANIMFRDDEVVAIFDWDTASMAGPEADLAWWRFMDGPASELDGIGTADELVERWQARTGLKVRHLEWHEVFTSFRLGCIMVRLFANMAAEGQLPPDVAAQQGRNSGPATMLAAQLDALR
jgi:aminoglycoside phosphotransferase (APT) family kinase protein